MWVSQKISGTTKRQGGVAFQASGHVIFLWVSTREDFPLHTTFSQPQLSPTTEIHKLLTQALPSIQSSAHEDFTSALYTCLEAMQYIE